MNILNLSRRLKITILASTDAILALLSWVIIGPPLASFFNTGKLETLLYSISSNLMGFLAPMIMTIIFFHLNDMYRSISRFYEPSKHIFTNLAGGFIFGMSWSAIYLYKVGSEEVNLILIIFLQGILLSIVFFALTSSSRIIARIVLNPQKQSNSAKPVIIYGAGSSGLELFYLLQSDPSKKVIAFIDDSKDMAGMKIDDVEVLRSFKKISNLVDQFESVEVFLAIPSIGIDGRRKILERLEPLKVSVRTIPSLHELVGDHKRMDEIQELSLDDLLPKDRSTSFSSIQFTGQTIAVTGAGGSIGSEIVRQVLAGHPKSIILIDFSEFNLFKIYEEALALKKSFALDTSITPILHDICNARSLQMILENYSIDLIYHAAAYKHVPMLEVSENILTGIKNNIIGTYSICRIARDLNVAKLIMISTDKAVRPTNLMGASKRFAEQVVQFFDSTSQDMIFAMVRFGNVINSSGSVIPTFVKQISQGGPLTVTDLSVRRYFMTIPEASNLVLQAGEMSNGGEVFILDMGEQVKIVDLAKRLINLKGYNYSFEDDMPGIRIIETGLRPGEKLFEELLISGKEIKTENPKIFKSIEPSPSSEIISLLDSLNDKIIQGDTNACIDILSSNVHGFIR
jgi:FlaA1/EpsC-like NDP-sugar epimerase